MTDLPISPSFLAKALWESQASTIIMRYAEGGKSTVLGVNEAFTKFWGYTNQELKGSYAVDLLIAPQFNQKIIQDVRTTLVKEGVVTFDSAVKTKDGKVVYVQIWLILLQNSTETPCILAVNFPQNADSPFFTEQNRLLARAEHLAGFSSWSFSLTQKTLQFSHFINKIVGVEVSKDPAAWLKTAFDSTSLRRLKKSILQCRRTKAPFEITLPYRHKNGEPRDAVVYGEAEYDFQGNPISIFGLFQDVTELRRARMALGSNRNAAFRDSSIGTFDLDIKNNVYALTLPGSIVPRGTSEKPGVGSLKEWLNSLHPLDKKAFQENLRIPFPSQQGIVLELQIRSPQTSLYHWIEMRLTAECDSAGYALKIHGLVLDIHARKKAEHALSNLRQRSDLAISASGVGLWDTDLETNTTTISSEIRAFFKLPHHIKIAPENLRDYIHPDDFPGFWASRQKALNNPKTYAFEFEIRAYRTDGRIIWVHGRSLIVRNEHGHATGIYGALMDITEQKLSKMRLLASRERFRDAIESTGECIFELDSKNNFTFVSRRVFDIFGRRTSDVLGQSAKLLFEDISWLENVDDKEGTIEAECHGFHAQKKDLWLIIRGRHLRGKNHASYGFRGSILNITHRKQDEIALIKAKRSAEAAAEAKARFLASMSHEIRTPLNAIIGMTELLLTRPLDKEQTRYAQTLHKSGQHLLRLVNDVLEISKLNAHKIHLEMAPFRISEEMEAVGTLFETLAQEKNLFLRVSIPSDIKNSYFGDADRLRQILVNLLSNALKFTYQGGITLRVKKPGPQHLNKQVLRFEVEDTGVGIAEQDIPHLFQEFSQIESDKIHSHEGTGLGLSISYRLVKLMKGRMGVQSHLHKGSLFWFELPFSCMEENYLLSKPANLLDSVPKDNNTISPMHILIAEDNPANQLLASTLVESMGHTCMVVASGFEAIKAVENNNFDLVLMDIKMPGMDGFEATRLLRTLPQGKDLPIVAQTAHAFLEDKNKFKKIGMNDLLIKPFSKASLKALLNRWNTGKRTNLYKNKSSLSSETQPPPEQIDVHKPEKMLKKHQAQKKQKEPLLDQKTVEDISAAIGYEATQNIFKNFESTNSSLKDSLRKAFNHGDKKTMAETAHALKGAAANLGFRHLASLVGVMESRPEHITSEDLEELDRVFEDSCAVFKRSSIS